MICLDVSGDARGTVFFWEASSTFADVAHFSDQPCEHATPRSHRETRLAPGSIHAWVNLPADYSSVDPRAPL